MSDEKTAEHHVTSPPIVSAEPPMQARQPSWPVVLGEISIFIACLYFLGLGCGALVTFTLPSPPPSGPHAEWLAASQPPMWLTAMHGVGSLLLTVLLFVGSIKLILRRPAGAWMCWWWSWAHPAWIIGMFVLHGVLQPPPPADLQALGSDQHMGGVAGLTACMALPFLWPAFLIVWFLRPKVRTEVRTWRGAEEEKAVGDG
jgi:hypothetical protein